MIKAIQSEVLEQALLYAEMGWKVVPGYTMKDGACRCGRDCSSPGKHPCLLEWQKQATTDEAKIREWFEDPNKYPRFPASVGVQMGPVSGIIDLEYDEEVGREYILQLFDGGLPDTCYFKSSKGMHFLFKYDERIPGGANNPELPGCDLKLGHDEKGSWSIFPPSIHPSGVQYEWEVGPDECEPATMPREVLDELLSKLKDKGGSKNGKKAYKSFITGDKAVDGERNNKITSTVGRMLAGVVDIDDIELVSLVRSSVLALNQISCSPPLPESEVLETFASIMKSEETSRAHAAFEDEQAKLNQPTPTPQDLDTSTWQLVKHQSEPVIWEIRWDHFEGGSVKLTTEQFNSPQQLANQCLEQADFKLPVLTKKNWLKDDAPGVCQRSLMDNKTVIKPSVENDRRVHLASSILSVLRLPVPPNWERTGMMVEDEPVLTDDDGETLILFSYLHSKLSPSTAGEFKRTEISRFLRAVGGNTRQRKGTRYQLISKTCMNHIRGVASGDLTHFNVKSGNSIT